MPLRKTVLITGGSSGIGLAIAKRFSEEGCDVIITGTQPDKLQAALAELGGNAEGHVMDMRDAAEMPTFVSGIISKYEKIDVLVNNAGINQKKEMIDVTDEDFRDIVEVNQNGLFSLTREVVKSMIQTGTKGNIINISSMTAHYGIPKVIAYTASKTAVEGMTRSMALDLAVYGIRVNCIAPGFIETNMTANALNSDHERKRRVIERTPMGKMGAPSDIASAAYFLSSKEASFITGVVLPVDGGNSIGF